MIKRNKLSYIVLLILLFLTLSIFLSSCNNKIVDVSVECVQNVRPKDFSIDNMQVIFSYKDGRIENLKVTRDMISDEDYEKLSKPGRHTITVNYEKNKSIQTEINLLKASNNDTFFDTLVQSIQKAAPKDNINGEIEASVYYEITGQPRKEYSLKLKFTLDIDTKQGAENYLELVIEEDREIIFGVFYKDNPTGPRPYLYVKVDGPFTNLLSETQNKFLSVSTDSYFGTASVPENDELMTFEGFLDYVLSIVGYDQFVPLIGIGKDLLFSNAAISEDSSVNTIDLDLKKITDMLPALVENPGAEAIARDFIASIGGDFGLVEVISGLVTPAKIRFNSFYDADGALKTLDVTDKDGNKKIDNLLQLNIEGIANAGINIGKISVYVDDTAFSLPLDRGIENWDEGEVSFERWVLQQYKEMLGYGIKRDPREGIEAHYDINYTEIDNEYNKLDVYRPSSKQGEVLPVIINVHGGGWVHGDKESVASYCQSLALQGFAVVNINYHLMPSAYLPKPIQDIFDVFNFVMDEENADIYGFDTNNVFLTGDSAGGHYAMLSASVLLDPELSEVYGVESDIQFRAIGVNSTGFTFKEVLKIPLPFAHYYVNQFFSDDLPYTAYRDDPRYIEMANSLNLENNRIDLFPPMFVSSAHGDLFKVHSERLVDELEKYDIEYIYDFREQNDPANPERFFLGHDYNVNAPDWPISVEVNNALCAFFKNHIQETD
ncbi:MAG: Acetyl esterase [Firmicutes bacterium ADurb.Bin080]|nr:MAG: Acetyl esterase [Firmicutes bacterium ADurb.Bin080]